MQSADNVKLGYRLGIALASNLPHVFQRHCVAAGILRLLAESTQPAACDTHVSWIDVPVDVTYFNVNRHINPTDVCVASCRLCAFGKKAKDPSSYTMSLEHVWEVAGKGYAEAVTEFHIVGGLHPELTLDWYCEMISGLKERYPGVHLKAFTMVEIAYLAKRAKISIRETLEQLKTAGIDSMPG